MNVFDIVNNISNSRDELEFDSEVNKVYNQFIINLALSYYPDTILIADELNKHKNITNQQHYAVLFHSVAKRKRFSKWVKSKKHDDLDLISRFYKMSNRKALEILPFHSDSDLMMIKSKLDTGGLK